MSKTRSKAALVLPVILVVAAAAVYAKVTADSGKDESKITFRCEAAMGPRPGQAIRVAAWSSSRGDLMSPPPPVGAVTPADAVPGDRRLRGVQIAAWVVEWVGSKSDVVQCTVWQPKKVAFEQGILLTLSTPGTKEPAIGVDVIWDRQEGSVWYPLNHGSHVTARYAGAK